MIGVILCGGSGSRLWPASTRDQPKQLAAILGDESLLDRTVARLRHVGAESLMAVTASILADDVRQSVGLGATLISEVRGRNTGPAVAAAAEVADPEDILLISPADHLIGDIRSFKAAVAAAETLARDGLLVLFGVPPTEPAAGFGYIDPGDKLVGGRKVASFIEKPAPETADHLFRTGRHLWNAGLLVASAGSIRRELDRFNPEIRQVVADALVDAGDRYVLDPDRFEAAPAVSFDKAVLEHTDQAAVVTLDAGWSDVGTWRAVWEASSGDADGNVIAGDVRVHDTKSSLIRATTKPVRVVGMEDVVVVETEEGILVMPRARAEDVRKVVD